MVSHENQQLLRGSAASQGFRSVVCLGEGGLGDRILVIAGDGRSID